MRKGVARSPLKSTGFSLIFAQKARIFEYFQMFSNVFEYFRTQLAHLIDTCGVVSARPEPDVVSEDSSISLAHLVQNFRIIKCLLFGEERL